MKKPNEPAPQKATKAKRPAPQKPVVLPKANENMIIKKGLYW